jgi:hypothetical protein
MKFRNPVILKECVYKSDSDGTEIPLPVSPWAGYARSSHYITGNLLPHCRFRWKGSRFTSFSHFNGYDHEGNTECIMRVTCLSTKWIRI